MLQVGFGAPCASSLLCTCAMSQGARDESGAEASSPVPWAGLDLTKSGTLDIAFLTDCGEISERAADESGSSSELVSDVAKFLAFSDKTCNS